MAPKLFAAYDIGVREKKKIEKKLKSVDKKENI